MDELAPLAIMMIPDESISVLNYRFCVPASSSRSVVDYASCTRSSDEVSPWHSMFHQLLCAIGVLLGGKLPEFANSVLFHALKLELVIQSVWSMTHDTALK